MPDSQFTPAYKKLVAALIEMRHRADLTQRDLADRLGREQNLVARIEAGQRRVDLVEFIWIANACEADPEQELLTLTKLIGRSTPRPRRRKTR